MEALKQRLSALKANAATDGGVDHIAKVQAWKDWMKETGKDLCDLLTWALGTLTDDTDLSESDNDGLTLRQLITDGMGAGNDSIPWLGLWQLSFWIFSAFLGAFAPPLP